MNTFLNSSARYFVILGIVVIILAFVGTAIAGRFNDDPCNYGEEWECGPPHFINEYDCGCVPDGTGLVPYPKEY